jgi:hypothetical protein
MPCEEVESLLFWYEFLLRQDKHRGEYVTFQMVHSVTRQYGMAIGVQECLALRLRSDSSQ